MAGSSLARASVDAAVDAAVTVLVVVAKNVKTTLAERVAEP